MRRMRGLPVVGAAADGVSVVVGFNSGFVVGGDVLSTFDAGGNVLGADAAVDCANKSLFLVLSFLSFSRRV